MFGLRLQKSNWWHRIYFIKRHTYAIVKGVEEGKTVTGDVVIASTYEGVPVTTIGENAFMQNTTITSVGIPKGITNIGSQAFMLCTSLKSVVIANCVTSIGYATFSECSELTSVDLGSGIITIGEYAFRGSMSLTSVYIPSSVERIENDAFGYGDLSTGNDVLPTINYAGSEEEWKQVCSNYSDYTDINYNCTK